MMNSRLFNEEIQEYNSDIKMEIGCRIQKCRIKQNLTGAELGAYLGITANQISRIERGEANCEISRLFILCQCLDVSADYLLFGKEGQENIISDEQKEAIENLVRKFENKN